MSGEGQLESLGKIAKNMGTYCYANYRVVNSKGILASTPWYQSLCITLVFLHVRSNYLLKTEEVSFQAKFCPNFAALPSLKLGTFFKF